MADQEQEEFEPIAVETQVSDAASGAKTLSVTVPAAEVTKAFNAIVGELASELRLPGFRPGKVPRSLIEKKFAAEISKQAAPHIAERAIRSAFLKEKLEVIGEPKLDVNALKPQKGQPFRFSMEVDVKPAFELTNYKGLVVEQEEVEILPEEVDEALERLRVQNAELIAAPPDYAVAERDVAGGELHFIIGGNEVLKEEAKLCVMEGHVLGTYALLEGWFLLGAKAGEKRSAGATLGQNFPTVEHRGQNATIDFEIKSIRQFKLPPLDDALAKKAGLPALEDLREQVHSSLRERLSDEVRQKAKYELLDRIVSATQIALPKRLQDAMSQISNERNMAYFRQLGLDVKALGEQHRSQLEAEAKERAALEMRRYFVIDAILKQEKMEVTEEDVDAEIVAQARQQNMKSAELYDRLRESGQLRELELNMKTNRALDFLIEHAEIKFVPRKPRPKPQAQGGEAPHAAETAPPGEAPAAPPGEAPAATESSTSVPPVPSATEEPPQSSGGQ